MNLEERTAITSMKKVKKVLGGYVPMSEDALTFLKHTIGVMCQINPQYKDMFIAEIEIRLSSNKITEDVATELLEAVKNA